MKYYRMSDLNSKYLFCHNSGACKPKIKLSADLFLLRPPWLETVNDPLQTMCSCGLSSVRTSLMSLVMKTPVLLG